MTTTHTNIAIVSGDICIFPESDATQSNYLNILASTAKLEGIPQLDRKHFVKPKVDVSAKATEIFESSHLNLSTDFIIGYRFGYTDHAKEAEFTMEDMEKIWAKGVIASETFEDCLKEIKPLSLPASVTLNENNEVISVQWE